MGRPGKWKKWTRRLGRLALTAAALVLLFRMLFLLYFREFYRDAERAFWIPGLSDSFVPQGIDSWEGGFLLSGYLSSDNSARLVWVGADGEERLIRLQREDGTRLRSHAGGVTMGEKFTYLAGGNGTCYVLSTEDILDPGCETATILGSFPTGNRASFCSRQGNLLLVGEYARGEKFKTVESHHLVTPSGEENQALVTAFRLDSTEPLGIRERPAAAYSIPDRVQGMCFSDDGRAILSVSGAFGASQLYLYDFQTVRNSARDVFHLLDAVVPLYYIDRDDCVAVLHTPPKAEEITFEDGKLYVLFESASLRFRYGKLVGGDYVYSMELPEFTPET